MKRHGITPGGHAACNKKLLLRAEDRTRYRCKHCEDIRNKMIWRHGNGENVDLNRPFWYPQ